MSEFTVEIRIGDSSGRRFESVQALVGTSATYTTLPDSVLRRLGVHPTGDRSFVLPDSRCVRRSAANVPITLAGQTLLNLVVFESDDATPRLGAVTLATFGLAVDPVNRRLIRVDALLKSHA